MSGKLALRLAVILPISALVIFSSSVAWRIYENHQLEMQFKAQVESAREKAATALAQQEADQRASQNH